MLRLLGYADRISVAPGETIRFMVSADGVERYRAGIVRLIHGDCNPAGPGFKAVPVPADVDGAYAGRRQTTAAGSYVAVPDHPALACRSFSVAAMIWPTRPGRGRQVLFAKGSDVEGFMVGLDRSGALSLSVADGHSAVEIATGRPMLNRHWYFVAAVFDVDERRMTVVQRPLVRFPFTEDAAEATERTTLEPARLGAPFTIGAAMTPDEDCGFRAQHHFNGKIDGPLFFSAALPVDRLEALARDPRAARGEKDLVAAWDFAREIPTTRVVDIGPNRLDGACINLPARAMKGWRWTGEEMNWARRPEHYGAIHFHEDDLYDCGWTPDFAWTVPPGTRSAVYCAHVRSEDGAHEDYIPFCVRPPRGEATADIAFLMPTASYMAYANDHSAVDAAAELVTGRLIVLQPGDLHIDAHRELGLALYDTHADGSGVCYSSRLRPILNMRPKYASWLGGAGSGLWQFNADTHLIDWLEAKGLAYDVITDEDLHREGYGLLKPYRVLLTGTHPEYHSTAMWDAMKTYLDRGGRLMYLGANGWYWRIAWHETLDGVIEVRRAEDGIRTWEAEPGEYYHSFTGEYGGLWRRLGRPPNHMVGTGFTAQGFDVSSCFRRRPDSFAPRAAFIFAGVGADERIGDFGLVGGGAAGLELDRVERRLGTPPHALLLASSEAHSDVYLLVNEEFGVTTPDLAASQNEKVRADLCFFETPNGGAVFSASSIAWCGSLSHNGYDNNVSRITGNVLRRFLDPAPFGS